MIHGYAQLSPHDFGVCRFFGDGLGNVLFPWARSLVAARREGLAEIAPTWRQVFQHSGPGEWLRDLRRGRGGAFWRGVRDYGRLFHPVPGEITGAERLRLLFAARHAGRVLTEVACRRLHARGEPVPPGTVVLFRGMRGRFRDLEGEHGFLREEFRRRARPEPGMRRALDFDFRRTITVHVRLGDFAERGSLAEIRRYQINGRLPMDWYLEKIGQLRTALGDGKSAWPVNVFSDGADAQLAPLLTLPGCRRVGFDSALADLLAMANANVMLCSLSTLNAWSAFLGRPPALHLRGVLHTPVMADRPAAEVESDLGEPLPAGFATEVRRRAAEPPPLAPLDEDVGSG